MKKTNSIDLSPYHLVIGVIGGIIFISALIPALVTATADSLSDKLNALYFKGSWGGALFILCIIISLAVQIYCSCFRRKKELPKAKERTGLEEFILTIKWLIVLGFFVYACIHAVRSADSNELANYGKFTLLFKMGDVAVFFAPVLAFLLIGWLLGKAFLSLAVFCFIASVFHGEPNLAIFYEVFLESITGLDGSVFQMTGLIMFVLEILGVFLLVKD